MSQENKLVKEYLDSQKAPQDEALRLRNILDTMNELICRFKPDGSLTFVNEAICRYSGGRPEDLLERDVFSLIKPKDRQEAKASFQSLCRKNPTVELEHGITRANGKVAWLKWQGKGIFDSSGTIIECQAVGRDITQLKSAKKGLEKVEEEKARHEDQKRQSEKMEALGTLAGGIAHDLNSSLGIIVTNTEIVLEDMPDDAPSRYGLELVLKASHRAMDLVKQILTFSRPSEEKMAAVRLGPIVFEALNLVQSSLPHGIQTKVSSPLKEDVILADQSQIHQVVLNLCTNAAWAMRESGGVLEVGLKDLSVVESLPVNCGVLQSGDYIELRVKDTGQGMDEDVIKRIFDPFFTTKGTGKGTGMGLSVVHGIVRAHHGGIDVKSRLGEGSSFHVYLPKLKKEKKSWQEDSVSLPTGTERVLLVDDDEDMVLATSRLFMRLGYDTVSYTDSLEALDEFSSDPYGFDIIVTDQVMPHMTGLDFALEVQKLRSDIPIILFTGYWEQGTKAKAREAGIKELLIKPIRNHQWAQTVRRVLDTGD